MSGFKKLRVSFLVLAFLLVVIGIIVYTVYFQRKELPVFNPTSFNPALVDDSLQSSKSHTVLKFELLNQNGDTITQKAYEGKIYVTDFFFTRCPSICPIMSSNMEKLQNTFLDDPDVSFLSISVTPELDSITVLKQYAEEHGAVDDKWNITTGNKRHIYNLARKSYFAVVDEGDGGLQDFIHTPNFVLVDKQKRIRGVYNGTQDGEIERLTMDIRILRK